MNTADLIKELSEDLKPVKRATVGVKQFSITFFLGLFSVTAGLLVFGLRIDITEALFQFSFAIESFLLLAIAVLASFLSLLLSIPGGANKKISLSAAGLLTLWIFILLYQLINDPAHEAGTGFTCVKSILFISIIPSGIIFWLIRKGAPIKRPLLGLSALLAGASYGAFASQFICKNDAPLHILAWHTLTLIVLMIVGSILGRIYLKKL